MDDGEIMLVVAVVVLILVELVTPVDDIIWLDDVMLLVFASFVDTGDWLSE